MSVHIRPVQAEDFDQILRINSASLPGVGELDRDTLRRLVSLASVSWVATDSTRVVGYLLANLNSDCYDGEEFQEFLARLDAPFLHIDQVAVCTDARSASIASQMYACLMRRIQVLDISTLCCGVNLRPANPVSLRFHHKHGFEKIGEFETSDGLLVALLRKDTLRPNERMGPAP